jgi:tetratricopeptide (TPR) repeat protein
MTRIGITLGVVAWVAFAGPADAEERSTVAAVREHDARAQRLFEAGDYAGALDALDAAQRLRPAPQRIFSMAVCQQRLGEPGEAIRLYRSYIDAPDADDEHRDLARRRIDEIRAERDAAVDETSRAEEDDGAWDEGEATEDPDREAAPRRGRRGLSRTPFYAMLGVTGALAIGVAALGGITLDMYGQYERSTNATQRADLRSTGWPMAVATDVLLSLACVSAAVAVLLAALTDWRRRPASASRRLPPLALGPGGGRP